MRMLESSLSWLIQPKLGLDSCSRVDTRRKSKKRTDINLTVCTLEQSQSSEMSGQRLLFSHVKTACMCEQCEKSLSDELVL